MANIQTLAEVQEVILNARIKFITGTEAEWGTINPILLDGEMGFIPGSPIKFKVGDGTTPWNSLGWGNLTALSQLAADASHRTVTDVQIKNWDQKARVLLFDNAKYQSGTAAEKSVQVAIVKEIVKAVQAGSNPVIIATGVVETPMFMVGPASGFVTITSVAADGCTGRVETLDRPYNMVLNSPRTALYYHNITFKADGTVVIAIDSVTGDLLTEAAIVNNLTDASVDCALSANMGKTLAESIVSSKVAVVDNLVSDSPTSALSAKQGKALKAAIDNKTVPAYSLVKVATESGFASTYRLTKDNVNIGVSINIPLDQVLRSSGIKTVTAANTPYTGAKIGDKYIEFLFQNNNTPQYLPVQDLVDVYTADNVYIQVTSSNVISLKYDALKTKLQTDLSAAFDPKGAGAKAAEDAISAFQNKSFVIRCTIPGMNE